MKNMQTKTAGRVSRLRRLLQDDLLALLEAAFNF